MFIVNSVVVLTILSYTIATIYSSPILNLILSRHIIWRRGYICKHTRAFLGDF